MPVIDYSPPSAADIPLSRLAPEGLDLRDASALILDFAASNDAALNDPRARNRLASAGADNIAGLTSLIARGIDRAKTLRQADVIRAADALSWVTNLALQEPDRLLWHIGRLNGIGPSGAWAYVAESRGEKSFFTSARRLDESRLMRLLPDRPNEHTSRGTFMEPVIAAVMRGVYGLRRDDLALDQIQRAPPPPAHPWLYGSLDDVCIDRDAKRLLIDYKCPAQEGSDTVIEPVYSTQLSLYWLRGQVAGVPFDAAYLARLTAAPDLITFWGEYLQDHPERSEVVAEQILNALTRDSATVTLKTPRFDASDATAILREAIPVLDEADRRVLRGEIAPYARLPPAELSRAAIQEINSVGLQLAQTMAIEAAAKKQGGELKAKLAAIVGPAQLSGKEQPCKLLLLGTPRTFDEAAQNAALLELEKRLIPTDALVETTTTVKPIGPEIQKVLAEHCIPIEEFTSQGFKAGFTRSKKGPYAERVTALLASSNTLISEILRKHSPRDDAEVDDAPLDLDDTEAETATPQPLAAPRY